MKLCPICDHELTVANYCTLCRRFVTDPLILSDGIYLNKSHFGNDGLCEFHQDDRKTTIMNGSHPKNERECSYHKPELYNRMQEARRLMNKSREK
jgi:hypothetical protein